MLSFEQIRGVLEPYCNWKLYVGFSGGADSLALLKLLCDGREKMNFRLCAVHCEHGLRGEASLLDAAFCRKICGRYQVEYLERTLDVPHNRAEGESVETAARRLRMAFWEELASNRERTAVVLAHHAGDRRENLFLRLFRGSGTGGLYGLRTAREIHGVHFLRPLLGLEKEDLEAFLQSRGESWRVDSSNFDIQYRRNFIRNKWLPEIFEVMPYGKAGMLAAMDALEEDAAFLEELAAKKAEERMRSPGKPGEWRDIPPALRGRILRILVRKRTGRDWIPGRRFLEAFRDLLDKNTLSASLALPGMEGMFWRCREGVWRLEEEKTAETVRRVWRWRDEPDAEFHAAFQNGVSEKPGLNEACFDADALPGELVIESGRDGDKMVPFGRKHAVKWKVLRTNRKIARRDAPPLLKTLSGDIVWSPGIRHSGLFPVTGSTRKIVCIHWQKRS